MNPVAFAIFGLEIRWYAIFITSSMLLGAWILLGWGKKEGFIEDHLMNLLLFSLPAGVLGARMYYVLFNWSAYKGDFLGMLNIREGGLAIHGGILAGMLAVGLVCRHHKMNLWKVLDLFAPLVALGQSIGRWGNYANQEAHGGPTDLPWGILIEGVRVHPTFLYESIWDMALFLCLVFWRRRKGYDGQIAALYFIGYSIGRFWIEGLRTDSLMMGPLRTAQVISLILILAGILLWKTQKKNGLQGAYQETSQGIAQGTSYETLQGTDPEAIQEEGEGHGI